MTQTMNPGDTVRFSDDMFRTLLVQQRGSARGRAELTELQENGMLVERVHGRGRVNVKFPYRTFAARDLVIVS
jgi:hypothetical protein